MNGIMLQAFEWDLPPDGTHWAHLASRAASLAAMGITAVWLPPATKGSGGAQDVGYGVYDLYDLGEFDQKGTIRTKYGTAAEYRRAVRLMRLAGIQTLADTVLNHRMGGDEREEVPVYPVDPENRLSVSAEPEPGAVYTRYTFPGRQGRYSDFVWDHTCFTGTDYNSLDQAHHLFLLPGKRWAEDVDPEKGNYDYLMGNDVDVLDEHVYAELRRWALWMLKTTGVDGFRLDAVKHISASFYRRLLGDLRLATGRELYAVGEYWHADTGTLHHYLDRVDGCMDLFDVPLHFHLHQASRSGGQYDMRGLFSDTLVSARPTQAVTFVDNHDTQPGQSLESWVDGWFKQSAYALILLREAGYPCVFWGDLAGIPARDIGAVPELKRLMRLRRHYALGAETDYFDDPDVVGFTRTGDERSPGSGLALLCTNAAGGEKRMYIGRQFAGQRLRCVLGGQPAALVDADGYATLTVRDAALSVYLPPWQLRGALHRLRRDLPLTLRVLLTFLASKLSSLLHHS